MADAHGLNPGDYGYDPSTEQTEKYNVATGQAGDPGNNLSGTRYKDGYSGVNTPKFDAAQPGQEGYDPNFQTAGPRNVDQFVTGAGRSLGGQKSSGRGTGFGNAVADVSNFTKDRWGDIMGTRNPDQISVGNQGQNAFAQGTDNSQSNQTRGMQMSLIQQLQDQANGVGPSLAQMQLQKANDQNISNAMALGQSQRGAGQAGMLKGIQTQQANIGQGMANDSAMLRLQEQMAARNQLGQTLGGVRGADMGQAQFDVAQQNTMANNNADRQAAAARQQSQLDMERQKQLDAQRKNNSPLGFLGGLFSSM